MGVRSISEKGIGGKLSAREGQMTVEWAVALPVFIIVAVIAVNALTFFSECAAFDRMARNTVRACAASPAYGQGVEQIRAQVQAALDAAFDAPNMEVDVAVEGAAGGKLRCTAILRFSPTLFGLGLKSQVFGIALPRLEHRAQLVVETYKPGVLF